MNKKLRLNQEGKIKLFFSLALLILSLGVAMVTKNKYVFFIFLNFNAKIKQGIWICIPYAVCLALNAVNSWSFSTLAGIGGILFLVSDAILSVFEKKSPKWQLAIWFTYVPAQICLLTAILINA